MTDLEKHSWCHGAYEYCGAELVDNQGFGGLLNLLFDTVPYYLCKYIRASSLASYVSIIIYLDDDMYTQILINTQDAKLLARINL